jgi:phosphoglycolate phosphatase
VKKHVFFDLDGTLIDSFPGIKVAIEKSLNLVYPNQAFTFGNEIIGPAIVDIFRGLVKVPSEEELKVLVESFRSEYDEISWKKVELYQGVMEVLEELKQKGITLSIFTNKPKKAREKVLSYLGIDTYFTRTLSKDSSTPIFENKHQMLVHLMQFEQSSLKELLVVGDSYEDEEAANSENIDFVGASYGYGSFDEKLCSPNISQFNEILKFI